MAEPLPPVWQIASIIVQIVVGVLQVGILAAAIWLAIETRGLRVSTAEQVELLRAQSRFADIPQLYFGIDRSSEKIGAVVFQVRNVGDQVAFNVDPWFYDHRARNMRTCHRAEPFLEPKQTIAIEVPPDGKCYTPDEAIHQLSKFHQPPQVDELRLAVTHSNESYALIAFRNRHNHTYMLKRADVDFDAGSAKAPEFFDASI